MGKLTISMGHVLCRKLWMFTRGYCISWKIWENLVKCWTACFDLHKLSVNSISLAIPIYEPWCWNMHTNICPCQITQFCRFLCTSTMVCIWDKLINFHGCPVSLLSQWLLTLQLLSSSDGTLIPLANNSMPFCLCGAPQWDFKLPFIDAVPIQTGCSDGATCRKFQCSKWPVQIVYSQFLQPCHAQHPVAGAKETTEHLKGKVQDLFFSTRFCVTDV